MTNYKIDKWRILLILVGIISFPLFSIWTKQNKEAVVPSEDFLAVLRNTDSLDELTATLQIVRHEIAVQRSRDTGGEQDEQVKQQLKSLVYVEEIITSELFPFTVIPLPLE